MLDIDRRRGTIANAVGPLLGTATGGLLSGLFVQYLPAPTKLVYLVLGVVFVFQAAGVARMPESVTPRPGALASLRPHFRLPAKVREPMLLAAPALVGAWSLVGFYGSLGPILVRRLAGSTSLALGGVVLFVLASSGALTVLATRTRAPRNVMAFGMAGLVLGVGTTLIALPGRSMPLFFAGLMTAGAGFGAGFQGAIRSVMLVAEPEARAGVLSIVYVIAYLAMGVPAVLGGVRLAHGPGLFATAQEYGLVVMSLAGLALVGSFGRYVLAAGVRIVRTRRRPSSSPEAYRAKPGY